jgi:branched-chain amino acid transport system ATP-binding protein
VFYELSVRENLLMGAYIRKDRAGVREDFERMYEYFPVLREREGQWAGTLSGGEKQMLAMARALMADPEILLIDEPTANLDTKLSREVVEIFRQLHEEGKTLVITSHDPIIMESDLPEQVWHMRDGRLGK